MKSKNATTLYLVRHCEYANPRNILPGRLPVQKLQLLLTRDYLRHTLLFKGIGSKIGVQENRILFARTVIRSFFSINI